MPLYEFKCKKCKTKFESLEKSDVKTIKCQECKTGRAVKQLTAGAKMSNNWNSWYR